MAESGLSSANQRSVLGFRVVCSVDHPANQRSERCLRKIFFMVFPIARMRVLCRDPRRGQYVQPEGSKALHGPVLQAESEWIAIDGPWRMHRHQSAQFTLYKGLLLRALNPRCVSVFAVGDKRVSDSVQGVSEQAIRRKKIAASKHSRPLPLLSLTDLSQTGKFSC